MQTLSPTRNGKKKPNTLLEVGALKGAQEMWQTTTLFSCPRAAAGKGASNPVTAKKMEKILLNEEEIFSVWNFKVL